MKAVKWKNLSISEKAMTLQRPSQKDNTARCDQVRKIITRVKEEGDAALYAFTQQFDNTFLKTLRVTPAEFAQAEKNVNEESKVAIEFAIEKITRYQNALKPKAVAIETTEGVICERQPRPIENVGLYVPGSNTPLISTAMMLAIPAQLAGCKNRLLCTPPKADGSIDPNLLFTAKRCGVERIYKVGGAQAIAAMAYGTKSIAKVDKIFGPGNAWVTTAKQQVTQDRNAALIDMPAGPSEVLVIADDNAYPEFVAADLLSQAEHGPDSQVMVIVFSTEQAIAINMALEKQLKRLPRQLIAKQSLRNSRMIIVGTTEDAINVSNQYAPEHLILQIDNPENSINDINNAGALFVGPWAPETIGDYVTGSNHVLPTDGYARTLSGLSVTDFMKFISVQRVTEAGLKNLGASAKCLASLEGLQAHKNAVSLRLEKINDYLYYLNP